MNIRRLQNGIGAASALGIAALLVAMAFESGSSPTLPDPSIAAGPTTPLTSTGDGAPPSGTPSASPATITPSATPTTSSSSSVRQPERANNHAEALPNATSSTSPSTGSDPTLPGVVALSTAAGDPPASGTTTTTTTTAQPPVSAVSTTTTTTDPSTTDPSTVPSRKVTGRAVTLGAGTFLGGTDVAPGLYDVTTGPDQSGHFVVHGTDSYSETLGTPGVPKIRVQVSTGDQIEISGPFAGFLHAGLDALRDESQCRNSLRRNLDRRTRPWARTIRRHPRFWSERQIHHHGRRCQ